MFHVAGIHGKLSLC